jgi:O-antigen ligase
VVTRLNRFVIISFSFLMLVAAAASAFLQQIYLLFIPAGLFAILAMLQQPKLLFYVLLASIPWSIEFNFTPSLGTDLPDEPLMVLMCLSVLLLLIYKRRQLSARHVHLLMALVFAQFLWSCFSTAASTEPLLSMKYLLAKAWYLVAFLLAPIILFRDTVFFRKGITLLMTSMLLFMFVALVRHAGNGWTFDKINDSLQPFFRNHVNYSALLVFTVPMQVACIQLSRSRSVRWLLSCTVAITVGALYFSYARGAWLALLTGVCSYWLLRRKFLLPSFVLWLVLTIGFIFWLRQDDRYLKFSHDYRTTIFHTNFSEHLVATYQLKDVSTAERIPQAISQQVEGQYQQHDGKARSERQHGILCDDEIIVLLDHESPAGLWRLYAHAEKTKTCFNNNGGSKVGGCDHEDGSEDIGQDMTGDDAEAGKPEGLACFNELQFSGHHHLSPNETGYIHPHGKSHCNKNLPETFAQ